MRAALAGLLVALFVPLLVLATAQLVHQWNQQRELAVDQLRQAALRLRIDIEREVALDLAVTRTLASMSDFDRQDWAALHTAASSAATSRAGAWFVVVGANDERLLNTRFPLGAPLPKVAPPSARPAEVEWKGRKIPAFQQHLVDEVLQKGVTTFSGLIYGPLVKGPIVTLSVPVVREGKPRYALSLAYPPDYYVKMLKLLSDQDGLIRVLVDRDGRIIARSHGAESFVGLRATAPLGNGTDRLPPEGSGESRSIEGTPILYANSRLDLNGWAVGVAKPRDEVLAPAWRSLMGWIAALLASALMGAFWAVRLWRQLAQPLTWLAGRVRSLDLSSAAALPPRIEEVDVLRRAMLDAARDQQVRREAERQRERAEARFRLVVESSPNGILMIDPQGLITLVNRRVEELFGYTRAELLGQPVGMLVPEASQAAHAGNVSSYLGSSLARAMGAGRDLYGRRKDGTEVPVEVGLVPIDADDGPFALASIVDISERKRSEDELRRSNQDLEQFAYVASHDLQEPLRMVANYTELLGQRYRGQLDEKADRFIHYAVDGARRMQGMVSDLLAFSRVGSQMKALKPVETAETVAYVLRTLKASIASAQGEVEVGPLPVVLADESQLTQVFQNLIGNALKFKSERPPHIRIEARRVDGFWEFSVKDNGIGFEPQYAERIFLMFQRLHERGKFDGSGIGLAIVKRIIDRHGGRIWAQSEPGNGSTFRFTLRPAPGAVAPPAAG